MWGTTVTCIEAELCGIFDLVDGDGEPRRQHMGRAHGMRVVKAPLAPPRATAGYGRTDRRTHAMMWILARLEELARLMLKVSPRGDGLNAGGWLQWARIAKKFTPPLAGLVKELAEEDAWWASSIEAIGSHVPGHPVDTLWRILDEGRSRVQASKAKDAQCAQKEWQQWLLAQARKGAGAAHKFVKRMAEPAVRPIEVGGVLSGSPQDFVDRDLGEWNAIWLRLEGIASAPWRDHVLDAASLPPRPTREAMRRAAMTIPENTAIGCDGIPPRAFAWLSDSLLDALADLFTSIERLGHWPEQVALAVMHLIPKLQGGRRPIGVLASLVRWWERIRQPTIARWREKVARGYNWAATGRRAEQSVWQ